MTFQPLAQRLLMPILAGLAALIAAEAALSPNGYLLKLFFLLISLSIALALTPQAFLAASVLGFGVSTAYTGAVLAALPVPIYFADFLVLLIVARGIMRRDRFPSGRVLAGAPTWLFSIWALVMAIAAVRAMNVGVPFASAVRGDLALMYWLLLYFGFTRVLRERSLDIPSLWRNLTLVALGLAGWMFLARAINHPFNSTGLAGVATGDASEVRRDFGFAASFIVYPALALVGIAGMAHGGIRNVRWMLVASVGTIATLLTLVRGEIFGLVLGALVILWLRPQNAPTSARMRTAVQLGLAVVAAAAAFVAASPSLGNAIVQRALPFTHQAEGAKANAEYRQEAVATGFRVARAHPAGLGVLDLSRLDAEDIDPAYLAHSGVATLLLEGGWPALVCALLALLAVLRRSFLVPAATPWLHPAFVGVMAMLSFYSIGAASIAGDPWVIPLGVLAVAVRFTLEPRQEGSRAPAPRGLARVRHPDPRLGLGRTVG